MGATSVHFKEYELRCRGVNCCGGVNLCQPSLLEAAEAMRAMLGGIVGREVPLLVASGSRCYTHNRREGGAARSMHPEGYALDLKSPGLTAVVLEEAARAVPAIRGIGRADHSGVLHVDVRTVPRAQWCYVVRNGKQVRVPYSAAVLS